MVFRNLADYDIHIKTISYLNLSKTGNRVN
jgi:hypothetical protein